MKPICKYIGEQENAPGKPSFKLFNLLVEIKGVSPVNSTVSEGTIKKYFPYIRIDNPKIGDNIGYNWFLFKMLRLLRKI